MSNPYQPSDLKSRPPHGPTSLKNPARAILIPIGLFCIITALANSPLYANYSQSSSLNGALGVGFGVSAISLCSFGYTALIRICTIAWSAATSIGLVAYFVSGPTHSAYGVIIAGFIVALFAGVGLLAIAFRPVAPE